MRLHGRSDGNGLDLGVCQDFIPLRCRADGRITTTNALQLTCIQVAHPTHLSSGLLDKVTNEIRSPVPTAYHCYANLLHFPLLMWLVKNFLPLWGDRTLPNLTLGCLEPLVEDTFPSSFGKNAEK